MIRRGKTRAERGQTIILVAISIVALLGVAALAIDVVTLYVASSEIKRAADAAALAGAKAIADSGVTALCATANAPCTAPDPNFLSAQALATQMACAAINAVLPANTIAGAPPPIMTCSASNPSIDWSRQGNPVITVSLTRTGLPTFFAKIWGRTGSTVSASSTAEVYNPSNNSSYTPIAPTAVKPWLVANFDPYTGNALVGPGNVVESDIGIGRTFDLNPDCGTVGGLNCQPSLPPSSNSSPPWVQYLPACVAGELCFTGSGSVLNNVCPSCEGSSSLEQSIECADMATTYSCGVGGASWYNSPNPGGANGPSAAGAECLTHASGAGINQQDTLSFPFPSGPPQITSGTYPGNPYAGSLVSTSSSIVTIPIIATLPHWQPLPGTVTVVGFMQAFINGVEPGVSNDPNFGDINITLLNIAGCNGTSNGNPPVVGGQGTSPVAVRLIAAP